MSDQAIQHAYNEVAAHYDQLLQTDAELRQQLWRHYQRVFQPGMHILDVSCGTGLDTLFLAQQGMRLTAIDISAGMLAQLRRKAHHLGLSKRISPCLLNFADLGIFPAEHFAGLISAFAGLNTVPNLTAFAQNAARLLQPGGRLIVHLLGRWNLGEWLGFLKRGRLLTVCRLPWERVRRFQLGGQPVTHYPFFPSEAYNRFFAPHFQLRERYSMQSLRPAATTLLPQKILNTLTLLEQHGRAHWPLCNLGRFFVLDMTRRP